MDVTVYDWGLSVDVGDVLDGLMEPYRSEGADVEAVEEMLSALPGDIARGHFAVPGRHFEVGWFDPTSDMEAPDSVIDLDRHRYKEMDALASESLVDRPEHEHIWTDTGDGIVSDGYILETITIHKPLLVVAVAYHHAHFAGPVTSVSVDDVIQVEPGRYAVAREQTRSYGVYQVHTVAALDGESEPEAWDPGTVTGMCECDHEWISEDEGLSFVPANPADDDLRPFEFSDVENIDDDTIPCPARGCFSRVSFTIEG